MTENGVISCPKHEDHERRIAILEEDYDDLNEKYTKIDKDLAVTTTSILQTLKGLEKLPDTLTAIKDTMSAMQMSMSKTEGKTDALADQVKGINEKVERVEDKVEKIDEEGKFNIRRFLKENWVKLIIGASTLVALAKFLIK